MVNSASLATFFALALPAAVNAEYSLVKTYEGKNFFKGWEFYNKYDNLTNGNVNYVSASKGKKNKLAYVNEAGNAIMKVDNTTKLDTFGQKRESVRIQTKDRYTVGSVWVADMLHVPYGCSVWPAWWSHAPSWPSGGEIDTFEAVNQYTQATMALHTLPGCAQVNATQSSTLVNSTDCSHLVNSNSGCTVTNPSTASYAEPFAKAGGGIWVTEYAPAGISIWFFSRPDVPDALKGSTSKIDTSALGLPVANWPTQGCDMNTFFSAQNLIFDITLCGDYAGSPSVFGETCSGICYLDYVLGSPSHYDSAYFEVKSVKVYGTTGKITVISGASRSATAGWLALLLAGLSALWVSI